MGGPVLPHYLSTRPTNSRKFDADNFNNYAIRVGEVVQVHYPDDATNRSKDQIEYTVNVQFRRGNGVAVNTLYHCTASDPFGSGGDSLRFTRRASGGQRAGESSLTDGARVLIACPNGETTNAVIISGVKHHLAGPDPTKETGPAPVVLAAQVDVARATGAVAQAATQVNDAQADLASAQAKVAAASQAGASVASAKDELSQVQQRLATALAAQARAGADKAAAEAAAAQAKVRAQTQATQARARAQADAAARDAAAKARAVAAAAASAAGPTASKAAAGAVRAAAGAITPTPAPLDQPATKTGTYLDWQYNGVRFVVNDAGEVTLVVEGPTNNDGSADTARRSPSNSGSTVQILRNGSVRISNNAADRGETIQIDTPNRRIHVTAQDVLTEAESGWTLTSGGDIVVEAAGDTRVQADGSTYIGSSNADQNLVLGKKLVEALQSLVTDVLLKNAPTLGVLGGAPVLMHPSVAAALTQWTLKYLVGVGVTPPILASNKFTER